MRYQHIAASAAIMAPLVGAVDPAYLADPEYKVYPADPAYPSQFVLYSEGSQSVYERQDAIVAPGPPGTASGHAHHLFGASGMSPDQSYESLQSSDCTTVGASKGSQVDGDKSVYWHPALYASPKDGSAGYIHIPVMQHKLYYSDVRADKSSPITTFPAGFRMVANNMAMRAANPDKDLAGSGPGTGISSWKCGDAETNGGAFPQNIGDCGTYPQLMNKLHFPHCWNNNTFDKDDPKPADMAYPQSGGPVSADCPASHPIVLPHIIMEIMFDQRSVLDKIDTNKVFLSQGDATGYGAHADFFNGWDPAVLSSLLTCQYGKYGNQDVGVCANFMGSQKKRTACKPKGSNHESILDEDVAPMLPGCNPLITQNPAPKRKAAPLDKSSLECPLADGSSSAGSSSTGGAASSSTYPSPSSNPDSQSAAGSSATTLATYVQPTAPAVSEPASSFVPDIKEVVQPSAESSGSGGVNNHAQRHKNRYRTEWRVETAVVTVTASA